MKPTTRGTLAAVVTGVAAAVGAAGATPAVAVPVPVPLRGAEQSLGTKLPEIGGEIPVPVTGEPQGPRHVRGRIVPERAVPQVPVSGGLPGLGMRAPLPHALDDGFDHLTVEAPAAGLRTLTPGLSPDAPLTPPHPGDAGSVGLPDLKVPRTDVVTPALRSTPAAELGLGPGL
ncbi:hypothetical protein ACH4ZX_08000 [Streptomyces sp. NPDC020490]|uniref:hypothetical protein n=1 Tax=Streptomyces sp. NPDC020490 TaxID=3365078 RepID=UPI0037B53AFA